ncbi:hypothetical protein GLOIN_2v1604813 [Rhizophagus clarus]|nr:hypothetical protein GLOIN_2v1604813 [Rhizophagus clarus]
MHTKHEDILSNRDSKEKKLNQYDFEGESSTLRQRRPNIERVIIERDNNPQPDSFSLISLIPKICFVIFLIGSIYYCYIQFGQNGNPFEQDYKDNPFVLNHKDYKDEDFKESDIASFQMNKFRVALRHLGVVMAKSDIIASNGHSISKVLFNLDGYVQDTSDKLNDFSHQSDKFFWILTNEMNAIGRAIKREAKDLFEHLSDDAVNFIHMRLSNIDKQITPFQDKLAAVIQAILQVQNSADNTQGYLTDGEREAQQILKKHWKGNIADYTERKKAESELVQIRFILKMLKDIAPNLINFESFLKIYRIKIQELSTEIEFKGAEKKITEEDTAFLKKAVADLKEKYAQLNSAAKKLGSKPIESYYIEDEMNSKNRDCTEFRALLKSSNAYLERIKIWSSDVVNAIAFIYTDGTTGLYGLPNDSEPYIFKWNDNEKIRCINVRIGAVLYAIQFETNQNRISDWVGGNKGDSYVVHSIFPSIGIHGSFSRQLCNIGIISH